MRKITSLLLVVFVGAFGLSTSASAQDATTVPAAPNIVDPANDANGITDGNAPGAGEDHVGPAGASTVGDVLAVWFSNTADDVSVHIQTLAPPPATNGVSYQVFTSPSDDQPNGCLRFLANIPGSAPGGGTYQDAAWVRLLDRCNSGTSLWDNAVDGEIKIEAGPEDSGITTLTFPRSYSPLLAAGQILKAPIARTQSPVVGNHSTVAAFGGPFVDGTKPGTDYTLAEGTPPTAGKTPPGKGDVPGKKKGAGKGKGKKRGYEGKGKKAPKTGAPTTACAPFTPAAEAGAGKPTVVVTDAATEAAPVVQKVTVEESIADLTLGLTEAGQDAFNIQVDGAAPEAGLYASIEFEPRTDIDLNLLHPDGSYAARSRRWNTISETTDQGPQPVSSAGHGGEGDDSSEKLVGIKTSDCGGWTLEVQNWLGFGGEYEVKLWLGEVKHDPQAPGEEVP